jgi:phi LC3 family holin
MRINWALRLKNKTTLIALITALIAFIYQVLGICGVVPAINQESIVQFAGLIVNLLVALGIVVDPTTAGVEDSSRAMSYDEPKGAE